MEKFYWLKLKKDFFKRHDIRIIESMPNGKDYILFYLKLICESLDHDGSLRFSESIPYNEEMLSTITNTNPDVVRSAIKIFTELNMMEIMDDGTYFMKEVNKLIGSSSQDEHTRESTRLRVQAYRERKREKQLQLSENDDEKRYSNVTSNGEIEKEIDIYKKESIIMDNNTKEKEEPLVENQLVDRPKNTTKSDILDEVDMMFEEFWKEYPKKVDKKGCLTKFKRISKIKDEFENIMNALREQKKSKQWQDSQYIPHPKTWLNQERWKDITDNSNDTKNELWNDIDLKGW